MIQFTLNGQITTYDGDPDLPLMNYLREDRGIISPKDGCAPQAACGCCVVGVDDKALLSCVAKMEKIAGKSVTTTEGLGDYRQNVFANAFVTEGGVQCGFCIPGIVMQANNLINHNPDPSRADIEQALTPHLCRCTGYKKIVNAIQTAADAIRNEEEVSIPECDGRIGSRLPKYHAGDFVLGTASLYRRHPHGGHEDRRAEVQRSSSRRRQIDGPERCRGRIRAYCVSSPQTMCPATSKLA